MTTLTDFEHKLDTLIKTYPGGVPRDEMNEFFEYTIENKDVLLYGVSDELLYIVCDKAYEDNRFRSYSETINGLIEEFREANPSPAAIANKQMEMNNLVRENAVSWAEKAAAQEHRNYLVSNTRIMDMMKEMMEHSDKMASENEKNQSIVDKIFALKFAPEPVKKPSIYERVCRFVF
jgi:hypothetical protein